MRPGGEDAIQDAGQDERTTVAGAAEQLGITKEAVRKRISRGTLRSDKDPDGTVRVYVPQSPTPAATLDRDELIAELRARIEDLRTDRDAWRDQARRSDYMASAALERTRELEGRLRELEAPAGEATPESAERPQTVEREPEGAEPRPDAPGPQEGALRPWWRRVFGR